ncbi:hypothetical protein [Rhodopseudomonas telluris]|uniref:Uncharacterized protein n=1 Tax=Rhodopseudomonas telluris TaxID=644215 RepID=A0ABV6ETJ2_9BRAD
MQLELAVIVDGRVEWTMEPCRRVIGGWVHCETHEFVPRRPTHWRPAHATSRLGFAPLPEITGLPQDPHPEP